MAHGGESEGPAGGGANGPAARHRAAPSTGDLGGAESEPAPSPSGTRAWAILLGLSLGVAVSNGFARFAYGLILPAMREDLGWSYTEAGWINTANALGYIVGSLAVFALVRRVRAERLFVGGLLAASLSLVASGLTADFLLLTLWRVLAGIGGALAFVSGGSLAAALFRDDVSRSALAVAVYFGGGGVGLALGGAALPALFARLGASAWPEAWIGLGIASLALTGVAALAARALSTPLPAAGRLLGAPLPVRAMAAILLGYAGFATGYIVYMTFLAAFMATLSAGPALVSAVWIVVGLGSIVSPVLWRPVLARFSGGAPLALANGMLARRSCPSWRRRRRACSCRRRSSASPSSSRRPPSPPSPGGTSRRPSGGRVSASSRSSCRSSRRWGRWRAGPSATPSAGSTLASWWRARSSPSARRPPPGSAPSARTDRGVPDRSPPAGPASWPPCTRRTNR